MLGTGALKSPPDARDWIAESIFAPRSQLNIPKELDLRKELPSVRSQGSRGTCAAFAACALKEHQERNDVDFRYHMSPEFIYFQRSNKPGRGMYGRDVMKILKEYGSVPEYLLPYRAFDIESIPAVIYKDAANFKIESYAQVSTIDGLKTALYKNGVCYTSFPVYKHRPEFWRAEKGEEATGGHAVAVVGYNSKGFILRNSWGQDWNGDGHVIYPYKEWGRHWEIWTCIDQESSVPDKPSKLKLCLNAGIPIADFILKLFRRKN